MTRFAYLFPGQGSQYPSMGRDLHDAYPCCREVFAATDRVLALPLSEICFDGSAEELALTENTQPGILTVSIAALRALEAKGLRPSAAAGHSLGEYAALVAAGVLAAEDAVRTVRLRGRFMQEAVPVGQGAMAAILGLDRTTVENLCREVSEGEVVGPANYNAPLQTVIAGETAAVERAVLAARQAGARRVVRLAVSAPFHCELMLPATERLRPVLAALDLKDPQFPVYTNVDAAPARSGAAARDALLRQVASPVRWCEVVEAMLSSGIETFVEVGPGTVLAGLMRSIRREVRVLSAADREHVEHVATALGAAA